MKESIKRMVAVMVVVMLTMSSTGMAFASELDSESDTLEIVEISGGEIVLFNVRDTDLTGGAGEVNNENGDETGEPARSTMMTLKEH